jgi:hypothetical protein
MVICAQNELLSGDRNVTGRDLVFVINLSKNANETS